MTTQQLRSVKDVLEVLLERDGEDIWYERYLCLRCTELLDNGKISVELWTRTRKFIMDKIEPYSTLAEFHAVVELGWSPDEDRPFICRVRSAGWPKIRQSYLRKWLDELSTNDDSSNSNE